MERLLSIVQVALILLSLSSCYLFGPADGGFRVTGVLRANEGKLPDMCSLQLRNYAGEPSFGPVSVASGQFKTHFTVPPYKSDYWLFISCVGYQTQRTLVRYGKAVTPSKPLMLGEIVLMKGNWRRVCVPVMPAVSQMK
jgi:hypothetical protein